MNNQNHNIDNLNITYINIESIKFGNEFAAYIIDILHPKPSFTSSLACLGFVHILTYIIGIIINLYINDIYNYNFNYCNFIIFTFLIVFFTTERYVKFKEEYSIQFPKNALIYYVYDSLFYFSMIPTFFISTFIFNKISLYIIKNNYALLIISLLLNYIIHFIIFNYINSKNDFENLNDAVIKMSYIEIINRIIRDDEKLRGRIMCETSGSTLRARCINLYNAITNFNRKITHIDLSLRTILCSKNNENERTEIIISKIDEKLTLLKEKIESSISVLGSIIEAENRGVSITNQDLKLYFVSSEVEGEFIIIENEVKRINDEIDIEFKDKDGIDF